MCPSFCVCAAGVRALAGINTLAVTNTWYMQDQNSTEIAYSGVKSNTEAGARAHGARAGGGAASRRVQLRGARGGVQMVHGPRALRPAAGGGVRHRLREPC